MTFLAISLAQSLFLVTCAREMRFLPVHFAPQSVNSMKPGPIHLSLCFYLSTEQWVLKSGTIRVMFYVVQHRLQPTLQASRHGLSVMSRRKWKKRYWKNNLFYRNNGVPALKKAKPSLTGRGTFIFISQSRRMQEEKVNKVIGPTPLTHIFFSLQVREK